MSVLLTDEALQNYPFAETSLPFNWVKTSLADMASEVNPGFASGKHSSDGSGIHHLRPMNINRDGSIDLGVIKSISATNGIELQQGDVLFNNTNSAELIGKTAVVSIREQGFAFSNHMTRVRLEPGISSEYVARQLHFLWMSGYMKHRCTNYVNQASISSKTLANTIPFLLPPSAEQTRIVEKLEELLSDLDAGVAELKAARKKLAHYRQSLLKAAVEGALTAEWRRKKMAARPELVEGPSIAQDRLAEALPHSSAHTSTSSGRTDEGETGTQLLDRILHERRRRWEAKQLAKFKEQGKTPPKDWQDKYPEPVQPDTSDLPELPEGWVWASLDQLVAESSYGTSVKCSYESDGPPVLRIPNVVARKLDLRDLKFATQTLGLVPADYLTTGDVLVVRTNGSPQDPNDEPAGELLERIRAERATRGTARGRKTKKTT